MQGMLLGTGAGGVAASGCCWQGRVLLQTGVEWGKGVLGGTGRRAGAAHRQSGSRRPSLRPLPLSTCLGVPLLDGGEPLAGVHGSSPSAGARLVVAEGAGAEGTELPGVVVTGGDLGARGSRA